MEINKYFEEGNELKTLIIVAGVLFFLTWVFVYFKYFRDDEKKAVSIFHRNRKEKTYSVAPWGDDNNDGLVTSPWKTLQCAVNNLHPGDRLLIREGIYKEYLAVKKSGTDENPIIISVYEGEKAVLDGEGVGWKYGFNFDFGVSFVNLSGLQVQNFEEYGVALWGENQSVQLKDLEVLGCGTGVHIISAINLQIENCNFHNNSGPGLVVSPGPLNTARIVNVRSAYNDNSELPDGFALDSGVDITIEKCKSEYNTGNGFNCSTSNTTIFACNAQYNGRHGIKCLGEGYKLVNCIIDSNGMAGIALQGGGLYELYNNLIANCGMKGHYGLLATSQTSSTPTSVALVNNIFAFNNGGVHMDDSTEMVKEDHNIYWSREDAEISNNKRRYSRSEINEQVWFKEMGIGVNSFCQDPLFVDPSSHDFRLAINSLAIDCGAKEGAPSTDYNGSIRPQGRGVDIGPYESAEGSLIPPAARIEYCPVYSSDISDSLKFNVQWAGYIDRGQVGGFNIQVKDGAWGTWQNWLAETQEKESEFCGVSGHTYYFRVRAKDDLGDWGNWSDNRYTIVPVDDQSPLIKYEGDWKFIDFEGSFLETVHYSDCPGAVAFLKFTGTEIAWISSRGPDRGQAVVYLNDVITTTIDLYSMDYQPRLPVFSRQLDGKPHTIRIEVAKTRNEKSNGCRVDVEGFAVKL